MLTFHPLPSDSQHDMSPRSVVQVAAVGKKKSVLAIIISHLEFFSAVIFCQCLFLSLAYLLTML